MNEIGVPALRPVGNALQKRVLVEQSKIVPAHVRDGQAFVVGGDANHVAGHPAETRRLGFLEPPCGEKLRADADAEERPATGANGFLQRLDHAGDGVEPRAAVGEGTDAGQHDAVRRAHALRVVGHLDLGARATLARGALEGLAGRMEVARLVVDDGDAHQRPPRGSRSVRLGDGASVTTGRR